MTRSTWLVIAGVSAFLLFIVAGVPASVALRWLGPDVLRLSGVSGSLWRGAAAGANVGKLRLSETQWKLSPLGLLLGRVSGEVETKIGDGTAHGSVAVSLSGGFACTGCSFEGPIASLRPLIPALKAVDGKVSIEMATLEIRNKWPTRAVGSAKLSNVPIGVSGQPPRDAPVGAFETTLSADPVPDDGAIEATIQDAGGPLELSARLSITRPGNFEFSGRAKARPGAPPEIVNALAALGPKGSDGSTELGLSGTF